MPKKQHQFKAAGNLRFRRVDAEDTVSLPVKDGVGFMRVKVQEPSLYLEDDEMAYLITLEDLKKAIKE